MLSVKFIFAGHTQPAMPSAPPLGDIGQQPRQLDPYPPQPDPKTGTTTTTTTTTTYVTTTETVC